MALPQSQLSAAQSILACPPPSASPGERFADMVQQRPELAALPPLTPARLVTATDRLQSLVESSPLPIGDGADTAPPQPFASPQPAALASRADLAVTPAPAPAALGSGDAASNTAAAPQQPVQQAAARLSRLGTVSGGRRTARVFFDIPEHAELVAPHPEEPLFHMGLRGSSAKRSGRHLGRSNSTGAHMQNGDGKADEKSPRAAQPPADVEAGGPGSPGRGGASNRDAGDDQGDTGMRALLRKKWPHVPFYSDIGTGGPLLPSGG